MFRGRPRKSCKKSRQPACNSRRRYSGNRCPQGGWGYQPCLSPGEKKPLKGGRLALPRLQAELGKQRKNTQLVDVLWPGTLINQLRIGRVLLDNQGLRKSGRV